MRRNKAESRLVAGLKKSINNQFLKQTGGHCPVFVRPMSAFCLALNFESACTHAYLEPEIENMKKLGSLLIFTLLLLIVLWLVYWYYQKKIVEIDNKLRATNIQQHFFSASVIHSTFL